VIEYLEAVIARFEGALAPQYTFWFYYMLSDVYLHRGIQDRVQKNLEQAEGILKKNRIRQNRGVLAHQWGRFYEHNGRLDEARKQYERGLKAYMKSEDIEGQSMLTGCLANIHRIQGRYDEAKIHYDAALRMYRNWGNLARAAMIQGNQGNMLKQLGEFDAANEAYQESGQVFEQLGRRTHQAVSLGNQGELLLRMHRIDEAKEVLEASLALCRETNFKAEGAFLTYMGRAHRLQGDFDTAATTLEQSVVMLRETAQVSHLAVALCERGLLALARRDVAKAKSALVEAEKIALNMEANPQSDLGFAVIELRQGLSEYVPWYKAIFRRGT
jgi:tetratricopeptide (TPR) repeat protein